MGYGTLKNLGHFTLHNDLLKKIQQVEFYSLRHFFVAQLNFVPQFKQCLKTKKTRFNLSLPNIALFPCRRLSYPMDHLNRNMKLLCFSWCFRFVCFTFVCCCFFFLWARCFVKWETQHFAFPCWSEKRIFIYTYIYIYIYIYSDECNNIDHLKQWNLGTTKQKENLIFT